uniref:Pentraxin family member n=1 Tax=Neogobius melanostomus TaxID=47308 RepID=A0A8C6V215_9GOBI
MSGKMLVFPEETYKAPVRLTTSTQNLGAVTVCLRYLTDLTRGTTYFSLATPSHFNGFLIYKYGSSNEISVFVRDTRSIFKGQDFQLSRWQSVCSTWDAASGLVQLWLDGKPSSMKFITNTNITGPMIIVLGQVQYETHGGGFVTEDSFMGMISDIHMWDHVLPPCHIEYYTNKQSFPVLFKKCFN